MSRREFSHATWYRVHTCYAGTVHARPPAGAKYAAQRDAHTVHGGDPPRLPAPPASQSPVRKGMSRREFSHATWHRVHTYYAGTVHARAAAGAKNAAQRDDHVVHGRKHPATPTTTTCQPVTSKELHGTA